MEKNEARMTLKERIASVLGSEDVTVLERNAGKPGHIVPLPASPIDSYFDMNAAMVVHMGRDGDLVYGVLPATQEHLDLARRGGLVRKVQLVPGSNGGFRVGAEYVPFNDWYDAMKLR